MVPLQCKQGSDIESAIYKIQLVAMQQPTGKKEYCFDMQQSMHSEQWSDSVDKKIKSLLIVLSN